MTAACKVSRPSATDQGDQLLQALASDCPTEATMRTLWTAARAWLANGAAMPLERHAHLPATPNAVRTASRNLWLCRAGELLSSDANASATSHALERELRLFVMRGPWLHWSKNTRPPDDASEFRAALFYVAAQNKGALLSARQIYRIIAKK